MTDWYQAAAVPWLGNINTVELQINPWPLQGQYHGPTYFLAFYQV